MPLSESRTRVAIVRCPDYEPGRVLESARRAVELLGGLDGLAAPGQKVLVKPNLLKATDPARAVTTHPSVVRAMVTLLREAGAEVWVGDSPGGLEWGNVLPRVLEATGVGAAAVEAGAAIQPFDVGNARFVDLPDGEVLKRFALAAPVLDADAVVTLPKLKTHGQALYTGAVKNLLGCVPGGGKIRVHQLAPKSRPLAAALLDIYSVVRPKLALIDAIVAMEGAGPTHGDPRPLGLLIASRDAVAADAVACAVVGYAPRVIHILGQAARRGLGVGDLAHIEIVGEPLESVVCRDFARASYLLLEMIPRPLARLVGRAVAVTPEIDPAACRGCGLCARSCPVEAIHRVAQPPPAVQAGEEPTQPRAAVPHGPYVIDRAACIRCFCCHELCGHGAVLLRRSWLLRLYEAQRRRRRERKAKRQAAAQEERQDG